MFGMGGLTVLQKSVRKSKTIVEHVMILIKTDLVARTMQCLPMNYKNGGKTNKEQPQEKRPVTLGHA